MEQYTQVRTGCNSSVASRDFYQLRIEREQAADHYTVLHKLQDKNAYIQTCFSVPFRSCNAFPHRNVGHMDPDMLAGGLHSA